MSDLHELFKKHEERLKADHEFAKAEEESFKRKYPHMADLPNRVNKMMSKLAEQIQTDICAINPENRKEMRSMIDARELPDEVEAEDRLRIYREKSTGALYGLTRAQFEGSVWMQQRYEEANL